MLNQVKISFYSRSINEGFARAALAAFLVQADSLEEKMALCALMGGVGYEAAADNRWVRTCQDVQADYRLEFWDAAGAPLPSDQGMLSGEAQKFPS